jgi:surfactin synthase thioesterase subunit
VTASKWFLKEPVEDAEFRLFCFPYSGCGASMYRAWPERLGPVEFVRLQLPWRENRMREEHFGTYEQLASDLVPAIADYLDRPYGVFGHCGGALPAFETVLRAEAEGLRAPARCFMSSQVAPQDGPYGRYLGLTEEGLRGELTKLLSALGADNPSPDLLDLFLEVLQADLEANKRYYKAEPTKISCPITLIGWDNDDEVPPDVMTGWEAWAPVEKHLLQGTHYTFLEAPPALQELLRRDLTGD